MCDGMLGGVRCRVPRVPKVGTYCDGPGSDPGSDTKYKILMTKQVEFLATAANCQRLGSIHVTFAAFHRHFSIRPATSSLSHRGLPAMADSRKTVLITG